MTEARFRRRGPAAHSSFNLRNAFSSSIPQSNPFLLEKPVFLPSLPICPLCSIKGAEWKAISIKVYSCLHSKVSGFSLFCLYPSQTSPHPPVALSVRCSNLISRSLNLSSAQIVDLAYVLTHYLFQKTNGL